MTINKSRTIEYKDEACFQSLREASSIAMLAASQSAYTPTTHREVKYKWSWGGWAVALFISDITFKGERRLKKPNKKYWTKPKVNKFQNTKTSSQADTKCKQRKCARTCSNKQSIKTDRLRKKKKQRSTGREDTQEINRDTDEDERWKTERETRQDQGGVGHHHQLRKHACTMHDGIYCWCSDHCLYTTSP